jgi:hypothetical protein
VIRHESHLGRWTHASRRPASLARFVDSNWHFEGRLTRRRERIFPDDRIELNVHLGSPYGEVTDRGPARFPRVCLSGLLLRTAVIEAPKKDTAVLGVRLWPAGAAALLGGPVHELTGRTVALRDSLGPAADELLDRCGSVTGPQSRLDAAVAWLTERARRAATTGIEEAVWWAAQEIDRRGGALVRRRHARRVPRGAPVPRERQRGGAIRYRQSVSVGHSSKTPPRRQDTFIVTTWTDQIREARVKHGVPDGYHSITPYLQGNPADALIRFIEAAFGGQVVERQERQDGALAHAEGARSLAEPEDMPYGDRHGGVEDPSGNHWWIATRLTARAEDGR